MAPYVIDRCKSGIDIPATNFTQSKGKVKMIETVL